MTTLAAASCPTIVIDVDHHSVTAEGERLDVEHVVYRGHAPIENVVPMGCFSL